jgi:Lrp/AsnC family transcriptional regulator for asnA, asnC and gidA
MDNLDIDILDLLQKRGYQVGLDALALELGKSSKTIQRHLYKMRQQNIFSVVVVPNFVALGFNAWATINIKVEPSMLSRVASALSDNPSIYYAAYCLGATDLMIAVAFVNLSQLNNFIYTELRQIHGITSYEVYFHIRPIKYFRNYWPSSLYGRLNVAFGNKGNTYEHPLELDLMILNALHDDFENTPAKIGGKLGISQYKVRKRIKFLQDNHCFSLEVLPNYNILKNEIWATIGINTKYSFNDQMLNIIVNDPNVYFVTACLGRFDLFIAVRFNNIDLLYQFIQNKLVLIKGIDSVQTYMHNKPIKYHNNIKIGL